MNLSISNCVSYLNKHVEKVQPLAKLFRTDLYGYLYDTGTSKVLQCDDVEFSILEKLASNELESSIDNIVEKYGQEQVEEGLINIKNVIDNENVLKSKQNSDFYSVGHSEELEERINKGLEQITLELTEQCNLRCGYCIYNDTFYGKRNHGVKEMSSEVAKAAIKYVADHGNKEDVAVTFYGGEPLIKFPLIKECVEYSKNIIKSKNISFSMTTNLLLMTPEIAKYIASVDNFSVVCSLDGPKYMHDDYRKDLNGNGSYERVINGLKCLVETFGESAKRRICLSMVYAPPYYKEKADEINDFFNKLEWLPKEIYKFVTYPEDNSIPYEDAKQKYEYKGLDFETNHNKWPLNDWGNINYLEQIKNSNSERTYFTTDMIEKTLIKIHKRAIFDEPNDRYPLNGCCIPGARKLYICTDGKFLLCERISGSPIIGDVFSGINIKKIKDVLVKEYSTKAKEKCMKCWAVRLCPICYAQCYTEEKFDLKKRENYCKSIRNHIGDELKFYHKCMEINPKSLEYINNI